MGAAGTIQKEGPEDLNEEVALTCIKNEEKTSACTIALLKLQCVYMRVREGESAGGGERGRRRRERGGEGRNGLKKNEGEGYGEQLINWEVIGFSGVC